MPMLSTDWFVRI